MNEREFAELAAGHALNALSSDDENRYAAALAAHPHRRESAALDERTAALLAEAVEPLSPRSDIRDDLLARIAVTAQDPAPEGAQAEAPMAADAPEAADARSRRRTSPHRRRNVLFALAASVALIIGIGFGASVLTSQLARPEAVIALEQIDAAPDAQQAGVELDSGATATAHWAPSVGDAVLVADGLEDLDEDLTYELWYVRGDLPVSAGLFETRAGAATALLDGPVESGDVIAVTVEPAGGSPTGQPTTEPIIAIPTA